MGAAWSKIPEGAQFESVLDTVSVVNDMGMEVCCTFGMLEENQAIRLREAGCSVYNHNLDTSREFYSEIITTRSYDDRMETLSNVRKAGMEVCCGGIGTRPGGRSRSPSIGEFFHKQIGMEKRWGKGMG